ncbi:MAG TPA: aspartate carbamoyltransferase catalytic subunit [bacterium]|nr:aspartate carbamoyltransferase catalytic subunit [Candidatus Omnitrophota bacterium]HOJ60653.1 aspartate carbamoyltransferase catalytic subunit [bacterium]HOL93873.1 aspartate carbamoyltransferase catalytic subunit [bacterium]HPP00448.1 aspartate carbamoyltransferase catalytic subunit [bacterium]HXK93149.1 aspartate carbamoyltransferase catalytic subunit [bacterium]
MNESSKRVWRLKDCLGLRGVSRDEIELVLDTARSMKEVQARTVKKVPTLRGKVVVNLFYEPSTRTRTSFEIAAMRLSADVLNISTSQSSVVKGESLLDTAHNLRVMGADVIVMRNNLSGAAHHLARNINIPVINAGDGTNEHPTQALLDLFTIREHKGRIEGLTVAIVGDILHGRVAHSNMWGLLTLGAKVRFIGPPTLIPPQVRDMGVEVFHDMDQGLEGVDVVNMLRIQRERMSSNFFPSLKEYNRLYGLTPERLKRAKPGLLVMHPGPMNRGVEIMSEVADSPNSVILEQVTNGIAVRMALLYLLVSGERETADSSKDATMSLF